MRKRKTGIQIFNILILFLLLPLKSAAKDYRLDNFSELVPFLFQINLEQKLGDEILIDIAALFLGYPNNCIGIQTLGNDIYILLSDGKRILYDDHIVKSFLEELDNADLQDMLDQIYPPGKITTDPWEDFNPGGGRQIEFFKSVYGKNKKKASSNLIPVRFGESFVTFNRKNEAAEALRKANVEISALLRKKPALRKYIYPVGGTFNWRNIEGTKRLSPHSFGIAIDLNSSRGVYWRWGNNGQNVYPLRQSFPVEILHAFENNNFIWGGKWFFYDLMHFEYRPEIFYKIKLIRFLWRFVIGLINRYLPLY